MKGDLPASGRLRDRRLPEILTHLQRQKKTGVLVVHRNDQHKSLFIKDLRRRVDSPSGARRAKWEVLCAR